MKAVVVKDLKAQATPDVAAKCETLSMAIIANIPGSKRRRGCSAALKNEAETLSGSKGPRAEALDV